MKPFLVIHGGYVSVTAALVDDTNIMTEQTVSKQAASKELIPIISECLQKISVPLADCTGIIVHQGPGPFTTLRTVLATANGLAYARGLPLIGVDGLDAFLEQEIPICTTPYLCIVLNAFCNDVYYAFYNSTTGETLKGCQSIHKTIEYLTHLIHNHPEAQKVVTCVGNGTLLHRELLETCGSRLYIPEIVPEIASLAAIVSQGQSAYKKQKFSKQLFPLYMKEHSTILNASNISS